MALTKSRGNMYPFVTHTWNACLLYTSDAADEL